MNEKTETEKLFKTHIKRCGYGGKITVCQKVCLYLILRVECATEIRLGCCDFKNQHLRDSRTLSGPYVCVCCLSSAVVIFSFFLLVRRTIMSNEPIGNILSPSDSFFFFILFHISLFFLWERSLDRTFLRNKFAFLFGRFMGRKCSFACFFPWKYAYLSFTDFLRNHWIIMLQTQIIYNAFSHWKCVIVLVNSWTHL